MRFTQAFLISCCAALCALALPLTAAAAERQIPRPTVEDAQALPDGMAIQPVLQSGRAVDLPLSVQDGEWSFPADGSAIWRLALNTADATYIGLHFEALSLPAESQLALIGAHGQSGPFSAADQGADGTLWVPLVHGKEAVLEITLPAAALSELRFGDTTLQYGVVALDDRRPQTKAEGDAGNCHNNVACPVGDDWPLAIDATVLLIIGNQVVCNGALLNNTRSDGSPLIITADHCGIRSDGDGDGFPADSVTAIFNFQSTQCDRSAGVSDEDRINGATLLYRDTRSDTSLIRLDRAPPAGFNARYAGWDASGNGAGRGSGVHHPAGDLKKISLFDEPTQKETVTITDGALIGSRNQTVDAWRVTWADGVTEPGSSGSGLWTPQQQLIGVLSGGSSACGSSGLLGLGSGDVNPGPDFYGRLEVAFARSGELGTPIQRFLDPAGSGVLRLSPRGGVSAPPTADGSESDGSPDTGSDGGGGGAVGWTTALGLLLGALLRRRWQY
ncbi:hypothetical protein [Algiphilus sp.]|uniref:hypothetical protein n=1 Tax=Algiphilus sp. TaxID=1872431 RepID=UPI003B5213B4